MTTIESSSLEDANVVPTVFPAPASYKFTHKIMTEKYVISSYLNHSSSYNTKDCLEYTVTLAPSESSILLSDYAASRINPNKDTTLLPVAVRYADPQKGIYVVERPPFKISPDFSKTKGVHRSLPKILEGKEIWIPWTVSIISLGNNSHTLSYSMFFNDGPLTSFDDPLVIPWIPNVFGDGRTCFGDSAHILGQRIQAGQISYNLPDVFNYVFNDFFSTWNADISLNHNNFFNIFSDLGFLERLKERKKIPKQIFDPYNWYRNPHKAWPLILFALTTLSYQETLQVLAALKKSTVAQSSSTTLQHRFNRISHYSTNDSASFNFDHSVINGSYNTLIRTDHDSLTNPPNLYYITNIKILIKNVPEDISLIHSDKINSSIILSKVYSTLFSNLNKSFDRLLNDGILTLDKYPTVESLLVYDNILNNSNELTYLKHHTSYFGTIDTIDWTSL